MLTAINSSSISGLLGGDSGELPAQEIKTDFLLGRKSAGLWYFPAPENRSGRNDMAFVRCMQAISLDATIIAQVLYLGVLL